MKKMNFSPQVCGNEDFSGTFVHFAGASTTLGMAVSYTDFGKTAGGLGIKSTAPGKCAAA